MRYYACHSQHAGCGHVFRGLEDDLLMLRIIEHIQRDHGVQVQRAHAKIVRRSLVDTDPTPFAGDVFLLALAEFVQVEFARLDSARAGAANPGSERFTAVRLPSSSLVGAFV